MSVRWVSFRGHLASVQESPVVWESLIEPWSLSLNMNVEQKEMGQPAQADFAVESNDPFNINLSSEFLTVMLETSAMLQAKRTVKSFETNTRNAPPYLFKNMTGLDLELYLSHTKGITHELGEAGADEAKRAEDQVDHDHGVGDDPGKGQEQGKGEALEGRGAASAMPSPLTKTPSSSFNGVLTSRVVSSGWRQGWR